MLYPLKVGLPPAKNTNFVVTTWVLSSSECTKTRFWPALRPGPRWGSLQRFPGPLVGWGGGHPFPIALPLRRLRRLDLAATPLLLKEIYANGCVDFYWNKMYRSNFG